MKPRTKFGEDNFKHWKDTFKFQSYDDDNAEYKDVKIKMEDVMDRIDHYRKKGEKRKSRRKAPRRRGFFETAKAFPDCLERE